MGARRGASGRGAGLGGAQAQGDSPAARQGQRRRLWVGASGPSRTRISRRNCSRVCWEPTTSRPARACMRPARWPASRAASASMAGSVPTRTSSTPTCSCSGTTTSPRPIRFCFPGCSTGAVQSRRPHHPPVHPHHAYELRRRPHPAARAPYGAGDRQRHLPGDRGKEAGGSRVRRSARRLQAGQDGIGYGLSDDVPIEDDADRRHLGRLRGIPGGLHARSAPRSCPACPRESIRWLASLYGDPRAR